MELIALLPTCFDMQFKADSVCSYCKNKLKTELVPFALGFNIDAKNTMALTIECVCYACREDNKTRFGSGMPVIQSIIDLVVVIMHSEALIWTKKSLKKNVKRVVEIYNDKHHQAFMKKLGKDFYSHCLNCYTTEAPFRCGRCHVARYCSDECSRAYWKIHKIHCGLKTIFSDILFLD